MSHKDRWEAKKGFLQGVADMEEKRYRHRYKHSEHNDTQQTNTVKHPKNRLPTDGELGL